MILQTKQGLRKKITVHLSTPKHRKEKKMADLGTYVHLDNNGNLLNETQFKTAVDKGLLYEAGGKWYDDNGNAYDSHGNKY
jgi:hypothetical protein